MKPFFNKLKNINETLLAGVVIFIVVIPLAFYNSKNDSSSNTASLLPIPSKEINDGESIDLPTIKSSELPNVFDDSYDPIKHNFLQMGAVGGNGKYTKVLVNDNPIEEPVSLSYSDEVSIVHLKSDKEMDEIIAASRVKDDEFEVQLWKEKINSQISEFGQIARQYLPDDVIINYYEIDMDNDGIKEKLITLCGLGANHCADYSQVIKNNKVIISVGLYDSGKSGRYGYGIGITPTKDGFYIEWTGKDSFQNVGLCCPVNHYKTLFLLQNDKFIPVKQWEIPHIWKNVVD